MSREMIMIVLFGAPMHAHAEVLLCVGAPRSGARRNRKRSMSHGHHLKGTVQTPGQGEDASQWSPADPARWAVLPLTKTQPWEDNL